MTVAPSMAMKYQIQLKSDEKREAQEGGRPPGGAWGTLPTLEGALPGGQGIPTFNHHSLNGFGVNPSSRF
jgi:hypothetical protein